VNLKALHYLRVLFPYKKGSNYVRIVRGPHNIEIRHMLRD